MKYLDPLWFHKILLLLKEIHKISLDILSQENVLPRQWHVFVKFERRGGLLWKANLIAFTYNYLLIPNKIEKKGESTWNKEDSHFTKTSRKLRKWVVYSIITLCLNVKQRNGIWRRETKTLFPLKEGFGNI